MALATLVTHLRRSPWLKPARWLLWLFRGRDWAYRGTAWSDELKSGWDVPGVAQRELDIVRIIEQRLAGPGPMGFPFELPDVAEEDVSAHNTNVCFAYVLARAAKAQTLSLLDWGGGLGQHYLLARAVVPDVVLEYHCYDVPARVHAGRACLPAVIFHEDEKCLGRRYDLVVASASLQYSVDWRATLTRLAESCDRWLYITRLPIVIESPSFAVLQHAVRFGHAAPLQGWFVKRADLLATAVSFGFRLEREFIVDEEPFVPGAPEQARYRGFLFARQAS